MMNTNILHIDDYITLFLWQISFVIENNFKFNNEEIKVEYIKLREQPINWYIQCNTQDVNGNDDVDIIE